VGNLDKIDEVLLRLGKFLLIEENKLDILKKTKK